MTLDLQLPVDAATIRKLLPHRYPFLLVDRVVEFEKDKRVLAYKNITQNEPFFTGHFPDRPIMPGVLIIEALAQAGGLLTQLSHQGDTAGRMFYMVKVENARFTRMVVPGDRLLDDSGLRRFVNVYINDEDVRFLDGLGTPLQDGDTVTILPAVAGG